MKNRVITIGILLVANVVVWFQLNGQLKWDWWKDHVWAVCLMGIPISYVFWYCTKIGYEGFGALWPVRFMGFATSMITFPILTYFYLGETIGLKTAVTILLSVAIMVIQLI